MAKKILITGISGFIGRHVARQLLQKGDQLTAIVRPETNPGRIKEFEDQVEFVKIDLADIPSLKNFLDTHTFDTIVHIGAIRGGRKFSRSEYFESNVNATEQLILNAKTNDSEFIFCSSVGVFGAIPLELPANNFTRRQEDNYYHLTKIRAENLIQKYVMYGLKAVIIRPAITYGEGDYGFPYTLTKLIDKKMMILPDKEVTIHLTNVDVLAQAFTKLTEIDFKPGTAYNIADKNPVKLSSLAKFIAEKLDRNPSSIHIFSEKYFQLGEKIARFIKSEIWIARFELLSKSWFYDVTAAYEDLSLKEINTIPAFDVVTNWYKSLKSQTRRKG